MPPNTGYSTAPGDGNEGSGELMLRAVEQETAALSLCPFDATWADLVCSWVRDAQEAYWLAPTTPPPLTPDDIRSWCRAGRMPLVLCPGQPHRPVAYGELNLLDGGRSHYWLGHLIVDPARRGCGLVQELARQLLGRAFRGLAAARVSLVVFPENERAIACYRKVGFRADGWEVHDFGAYARRVRLLRMAIEWGEWRY